MRRTAPRQSGSVIVLVALALVVMLGIAGLVVDLGRLFVIKAELQNAADACALAAARELNCDPAVAGTCPATVLAAAQAAGIAVGTRNAVDFQSSGVAIAPDDVRFSTVLSGANGDDSVYLSIAQGADRNSRYAMCTIPQRGIAMSFMRVLGFDSETVAATAVATLAPSQTSCAIPLGLCEAKPGAAPGYGMQVGKWYGGLFSPGSKVTGSYDWINFNPQGKTPGCNGTGAQVLSCQLAGSGQCSLPAPGSQVGAQGVDQSVSTAWNSRFGLYKNGAGNPQLGTAPPDLSGLAYTSATTAGASTVTWPAGANAYAGAAGGGSATDNFVTARSRFETYQYATDPMAVGNKYMNPATTSAQLRSYGSATRRVAIAPLVDCSRLGASKPQTVPIDGYACVLMLHPISGPDGVEIEFLGLANTPGNACATSGLPGGSTGPLVPTLVQ